LDFNIPANPLKELSMNHSGVPFDHGGCFFLPFYPYLLPPISLGKWGSSAFYVPLFAAPYPLDMRLIETQNITLLNSDCIPFLF